MKLLFLRHRPRGQLFLLYTPRNSHANKRRPGRQNDTGTARWTGAQAERTAGFLKLVRYDCHEMFMV